MADDELLFYFNGKEGSAYFHLSVSLEQNTVADAGRRSVYDGTAFEEALIAV